MEKGDRKISRGHNVIVDSILPNGRVGVWTETKGKRRFWITDPDELAPIEEGAEDGTAA